MQRLVIIIVAILQSHLSYMYMWYNTCHVLRIWSCLSALCWPALVLLNFASFMDAQAELSLIDVRAWPKVQFSFNASFTEICIENWLIVKSKLKAETL